MLCSSIEEEAKTLDKCLKDITLRELFFGKCKTFMFFGV